MAISKEGIAINYVLINILYNTLRIMKLDFIKSAPPSTYTPGTIYFDNTNNIIKVATDTNRYIVYSGVRSAEYDDTTNVLTIINQSGNEIDIDLSQYEICFDNIIQIDELLDDANFNKFVQNSFQISDNRFQRDFVKGHNTYDQDVLMHTKAGYLRIGRPDRPFTVEAGLEMASQFGSTHYEYSNGTYTEIKNGRSLSSFWHAFVSGGGDPTDGPRPNNEGNMLGSWVLRLNYKTKQADYGLYADHFFDDHSAMFHINYDGYEYRDGSMKHGDNRFILYPLKDIMLGADIHLHNCSWLTDAAIEYVYTRYQSGPAYTDHNQLSPDQIGGRDNYYNNHVEPGWQHWGQTLGNPLYISPIYNTDDNLTFQCNRFTAWNLAIAGQPTSTLRYRLRASWQEGLGTYDRPFTNPRCNVSVCAEATYSLGCLKEGLSLGAAFAIDRGCLLGNSTGGRITLSYTLQ